MKNNSNSDAEKNYRLLVDCMNVGVFRTALNGNFIHLNEAVVKMAGYESIEEMMSKSVECLYADKSDRERIISLMRENGEVKNVEMRSLRKDQSEYWISMNAVMQMDQEGKPESILGTVTDITERKRVEEALKLSKEKFFKAFYSSPDAILITRLIDGQILEVNEGFSRITEYSQDEAVGKTTMELGLWLDGRDRDLFLSLLKKDGCVRDQEFKYRIKSGSVIDALLSAEMVLIGGEEYLLGIVRDITERKSAEDALRQSEERFRNIIELAPIAMAVVSMDEKIEFINRKAIVVFGYLPEDIPTMDRWWVQAYPNEIYRNEVIADWSTRVMKALAEGGEIIGNEYQVTCKDGSVKTMFISGVPVQNKIFVMFDDITARKQAEDSYRESRDFLRQITDNIPALICFIDTDLRYHFVSKSYFDLLGKPTEKMIGRKIKDLYDTETYEKALPYFKRALSGERVSLENSTVDAKNQERLFESTYIPYKVKEKVSGFFGLSIDITERRRTEEELQKSQKLESLGILAGGIAHDFNNLLGGIFGFLDLAMEATSEKIVFGYLEKSMNTIERARSLTQQLLTFARGGAPIRKVESMIPLIQETAQFVLSGSSISCSFNIPDDLWHCNIDKNQIAQVIENVVINASQAMPFGGKIELTAKNAIIEENTHPILKKGEYVKISIRDWGIGIPNEFLSKIFDPFFTTKEKGHGLGLATAYSIVNRHGGCIEAESESGKGTTFHLYLPAAKNLNQESRDSQFQSFRGSGIFLIMDDDENIRELLGNMLNSFGFEVVKKESGEKLLDYFQEMKNQEIIGMIFDLTIPGGMGGKDTLIEIRKHDKNIPVFVTSGYGEDPVMANPTAYGFSGSLNKPFRKSDLEKLLKTQFPV